MFKVNKLANEKFVRKNKKDFCEACSTFELENSCVLCESDENVFEQASKRFNGKNLKFDTRIGYYVDCQAVVDSRYVSRSTAGGLCTGLIHDLLDKGEVSHFIAPVFDIKEQKFRYKLSSKISDLIQQQRSIYVSINVQELIDIIKNNKGDFVVTGIPSTIQYIEKLKETDPTIKERVKYTIGLVSGGYKTKKYIKYLTEKSGSKEVNKYKYISFRDKNEGEIYRGDNYYFRYKTDKFSGEVKSSEVKYNWAYGLLKEFSSDFCYDTFNVAADITVMDGWLEKYNHTSGVTLAVIRNKCLNEIINDSENMNNDVISCDDVFKSQEGGYRHKTSGFNARIYFYQLLGNDVPKRYLNVRNKYKKVDVIEQLLRLRVSFVSRITYNNHGDARKLENKIKKYTFLIRGVNKIKRKIYGIN